MLVFKGIESRKIYVVGDQNESEEEVFKAANKRFKTAKKNLEGRMLLMSGDYLYDDIGANPEDKKANMVFAVTTKSRK